MVVSLRVVRSRTEWSYVRWLQLAPKLFREKPQRDTAAGGLTPIQARCCISITTRMARCPFKATPGVLPPLNAFRVFDDCWSLLHFYDFAISGMWSEWNYVDGWQPFGVDLGTEHNSLETHSESLHVPGVFSSILLSRVPRCERPTDCWLVHLLRNIWVTSNFGLFWIKQLWMSVKGFLCEDKSLFLGDKCPGV